MIALPFTRTGTPVRARPNRARSFPALPRRRTPRPEQAHHATSAASDHEERPADARSRDPRFPGQWDLLRWL